MEMIKVKTTGKFSLLDPQTGFEIVDDELRSVPKSQFVIDRLELKQLSQSGKAEEVVPSTTGEDRVDDGEPAVKDIDQQAGDVAAETNRDPLDHDGDGRKGGSKPKGKK